MFEWLKRRRPLEERLDLQRRRARARADQYAEPLDFPVQWDCGSPMPHLIVNDCRALLSFLIAEPSPNRSGSTPAGRDWPDGVEPMALVEFERCQSAKLGAPNDEVFSGHPLSGKGLKPYAAQRVVNSIWLKELETINRVHSRYNPAHWRHLNHYIFWFKDSTFECIAESFKIETYRESMKAMLARIIERAVSL